MGRWGGDEFMVLTPRSASTAWLLASSLREIAQGGSFEQEGAVTLSIGVAELNGEMDLGAFVGAAYDAMVAAKRSGGNRTVMAGEQGEDLI